MRRNIQMVLGTLCIHHGSVITAVTHKAIVVLPMSTRKQHVSVEGRHVKRVRYHTASGNTLM
jgi:hypothetical protein